jgi:hypothetical protein
MTLGEFGNELVKRFEAIGCKVFGCDANDDPVLKNKQVEDDWYNYCLANNMQGYVPYDFALSIHFDHGKLGLNLKLSDVDEWDLLRVLAQMGWYKTLLRKMNSTNKDGFAYDTNMVAKFLYELIDECLFANDAEALDNILFNDWDKLITSDIVNSGKLKLCIFRVILYNYDKKPVSTLLDETWDEYVANIFNDMMDAAERHGSSKCIPVLLRYKKEKFGFNENEVMEL